MALVKTCESGGVAGVCAALKDGKSVDSQCW